MMPYETPPPPGQTGIHRRIALGFAAKSAAVVLNFAQRFLLVPVFLHFWGTERYNDWLVVLSAAGFLTLADLGIQTHLANTLQMAHARGERGAFARILHQGFALYLALLAIAAPALALAGWLAPWPALLNLQQTGGGAASALAVLLALHVVTAIPLGFFFSVYRARGEYPLSVLAATAREFVALSAMAAALWAGFGLVALAALQFAITAAACLIAVAHQSRRYPELRLGIAWPRGADARAMLTTGPLFMLIPAAMALTVHGSVLVLATVGAGAAAVVAFTTMRTMTNLGRYVVNQLGQPAGAEFTRQYAQGDLAALARLYGFLGRFCGALAGGIGGLIAVIGAPFLAVWTLGKVSFDPLVFWPLLAAAVLAAPAQAGTIVLHYINRPRGLSLAVIAAGGASVLLCIALVPRLGAGGAALAVMAAELGIAGLTIPWLAARAAETRFAAAIAAALLAAGAAFVLSAAASSLAVWLIGDGDLPRLAAVAALWAALMAAPSLFILLTPGQRGWLRDRLRARLGRA